MYGSVVLRFGGGVLPGNGLIFFHMSKRIVVIKLIISAGNHAVACHGISRLVAQQTDRMLVPIHVKATVKIHVHDAQKIKLGVVVADVIHIDVAEKGHAVDTIRTWRMIGVLRVREQVGDVALGSIYREGVPTQDHDIGILATPLEEVFTAPVDRIILDMMIL